MMRPGRKGATMTANRRITAIILDEFAENYPGSKSKRSDFVDRYRSERKRAMRLKQAKKRRKCQ